MTIRRRTASWMHTRHGGGFHPDDPRADEVLLADIAHALARQCRFAGHCYDFYSVAQHSVLVSHVCPPALARWGLLHDAAEAYLGDVIRPVKAICDIGREYRRVEADVLRAIAAHFELPEHVVPQAVLDADDLVLATELRDLCDSERWSQPPDNAFGTLAKRIDPVEPQLAEFMFLQRARELGLE